MNLVRPNFDKRGGLLIGIVQDEATRDVLMHCFLDEEAYRLTLATRVLWRYSTTERQLMKKGASSGNVMRVKRLSLDCDGDAVLIEVSVIGDGLACHLNRVSCFEESRLDMEVE